MTSPNLPQDANRSMTRRMSAQNLLETGNPFIEEDWSSSKPLPTAADLLLERYDDFTMGDDQEGSETNPEGRPAPLTLIPTTTSNPKRPRTVAAGYEQKRKTMTVLFRDGVLFNFYDVDLKTWEAFKGAFSKGLWLENNKPARNSGGSWRGEKVTDGQSGLMARAIYEAAKARQGSDSGRGKQFEGWTAPSADQNKLSGYRRSVLKYVGGGMTTRSADARAKAELLFYRKKK